MADKTLPDSESVRDTLLPCPFCGGKAAFDVSVPGWKIMCRSCEASSDNWISEAAAIAAWNRRSKSARITKLEEAMKWALPLAEMAQELVRVQRIEAGHMDISYTGADGAQRFGLHQSEWDSAEFARRALAETK